MNTRGMVYRSTAYMKRIEKHVVVAHCVCFDKMFVRKDDRYVTRFPLRPVYGLGTSSQSQMSAIIPKEGHFQQIKFDIVLHYVYEG